MKFRKDTWLIALVTVLLGSCELLGIGGDDEKSSEKGLPKLVWTKKEVGRSAAPLVDHNSAYLLGIGELIKLNPETGEEYWSTPVHEIWDPAPLRPFIQSKKRLFAHFGESIRAWNKTNGSVAWTFSTGLEGPFFSGDSIAVRFSEIAQSADRLFVGVKNEVVAISKADGSVDYRITLKKLASDSIQQKTFSPVVSVGPNPVLYVPTIFQENGVGGNLFGYDAKTGEQLFAFKMHELLEDTVQSPYFIEDIGISGDKLILLINYSLVAVNRFTGELIWSTEKAYTSSIYVENKSIFTSGFADLYRFDANSGQLIWHIEGQSINLSTQVLIKEDRLYRNLISPFSSRVQILDVKNGAVLKAINASAFQQTEPFLSFPNSIAVYDNYLITQNDLNTYGIKFDKDK
ncbi:MAG TPA: PQQ-binding-like beta-propeller repeat protein [Balneolaceae bacterium]